MGYEYTTNPPIDPPRLLQCLALMAMAPIAGMAQQAQPIPQPLPPRAAPSQPGFPAPPADEKPFSLDFRGGPVQEFVEAVEKATKEPFNVIVPESAQDLAIPPVRVREVALSPLLKALSDTSAQRKRPPPST